MAAGCCELFLVVVIVVVIVWVDTVSRCSTCAFVSKLYTEWWAMIFNFNSSYKPCHPPTNQHSHPYPPSFAAEGNDMV